MPRKSSRTSRSTIPKSADDSGCLIILVAILWYFGFVSFHSRETGQALSRLGDVKSELAKAETQLVEITTVLQGIKNGADSLDVRRDSLERQVAQLERARDKIAANLEAASSLVAPTARSVPQSVLRTLFDGVPGNIVAAGLLGVVSSLNSVALFL